MNMSAKAKNILMVLAAPVLCIGLLGGIVAE
jgi:hypothetical protein